MRRCQQLSVRRAFPGLVTILFLIVCSQRLAADPIENTVGEPQLLQEVPAVYPRALQALGRWGTAFEVNYTSGSVVGLKLTDSACVVHAEAFAGDPTGGGGSEPAAAASDQRILLVFVDNEALINSYHLAAVLYDAQLNELDAEVIAEGPADELILNPAVAHMPGTDDFLVVFRQGQSEPFSGEVRGLVIETSTGQIISGTTYSYGTGHGELDVAACRQRVGPAWLLRYFVVWRHATDQVRVHSVVPGGSPIGSVVDFPMLGGNIQDPAIASWDGTDGGSLLVTWSHWPSAGVSNVVAQQVTASGALDGTPIIVSTGEGFAPDVTASDTEYLVVYKVSGPATQDYLKGRYCSFTGSLLGSEFTILLEVGDPSDPAVASDGRGYSVAFRRISAAAPPAAEIWLQRVGFGGFTYVAAEVSLAQEASRGVAWGDDTIDDIEFTYFPDLAVASAGVDENRVYTNEGGGQFDEWWESPFPPAGGQGVAWADYNNDGWLDLYLSSGGAANELYRGGTPLDPVGAALGVDDAGNGRSVAWGDYDGDGWLDLYVANKSTANRLFHNEGGTAFTEVGGALDVDDDSNTEGVAFIDYDSDGDLDIYSGNASSANRLYRNDSGSFVEVAGGLGLNDAGSVRSVSWVDYDNDGDFDLYLSKYAAPNALYRNDGSTFTDVAAACGLDDPANGESACWADIDLDGDQDLFLANYNGTDRLWLNQDAGASFTEVGWYAGLDHPGPSLGAAWADMDQDGDPDLCLGGYQGTNRIYQNDFSTGNHWVKLVLVRESGQACATGTRVRVVAGPLVQVLDVGGRNGYLSQNDLLLTIGLGNQTAIDSLYVRWSGGQRELFTAISPDPPYNIVWEGLGTPVTGTPDQGAHPPAFRLLGNWPNPFNPLTHIVFELPTCRRIELGVYDARGRRVTLLVDEVRAAGVHTVTWDGRDGQGKSSASGVYFVWLFAGNEVAKHKIVLAK